MVIKTKYKFGDILYLKNDPEQEEYFLIAVVQRPGSLCYELSYKGESIEVYDFEVSETRNDLKKFGVDTSKQEDGGE